MAVCDWLPCLLYYRACVTLQEAIFGGVIQYTSPLWEGLIDFIFGSVNRGTLTKV